MGFPPPWLVVAMGLLASVEADLRHCDGPWSVWRGGAPLMLRRQRVVRSGGLRGRAPKGGSRGYGPGGDASAAAQAIAEPWWPPMVPAASSCCGPGAQQRFVVRLAGRGCAIVTPATRRARRPRKARASAIQPCLRSSSGSWSANATPGGRSFMAGVASVVPVAHAAAGPSHQLRRSSLHPTLERGAAAPHAEHVFDREDLAELLGR